MNDLNTFFLTLSVIPIMLNTEKLLGVNFDASLNFSYHLIYLKKLVQKVHVLAKITP